MPPTPSMVNTTIVEIHEQVENMIFIRITDEANAVINVVRQATARTNGEPQIIPREIIESWRKLYPRVLMLFATYLSLRSGNRTEQLTRGKKWKRLHKLQQPKIQTTKSVKAAKFPRNLQMAKLRQTSLPPNG